jgi:lipoyl(octanoyl) transferase
MLSQFEIKAYSSMTHPGIYVDQYCNEKIASIGLKINKDGFSYHGISVNFYIDKEMFNHINPCGQPGLKVVNFVELLRTNLSIDIIKAEDILVDYIIENLYHESNQ